MKKEQTFENGLDQNMCSCYYIFNDNNMKIKKRKSIHGAGTPYVNGAFSKLTHSSYYALPIIT